MTHTKGPWHVSKLDYLGYPSIFDDEDRQIANVLPMAGSHVTGNKWEYPTQANARLIAQAPSMLAALEALFENCEMIHRHWGEGSNQKEASAAISAARAAISRARGEE